MKILSQKITAGIGLTSLLVFTAQSARAEIVNERFASDVESATGIGAESRTPVETAILLISSFLGLLGIIALVVILYAGFQWMTAGGNEEKITEAKDLLKGAVIGAAIILFSYTIAQFIFSTLESASGQGAI
jgi:amino acid transporter